MKLVDQNDPILRVVAQKVLDPATKFGIAMDMLEFIRDDGLYPGYGLAAPQIGISERLFVLRVNGLKMVVINPEINERQGEVFSEEACLSCPGTNRFVPRARRIRVKYWNEHGHPKHHWMEGDKAIVFQHENDHLNGILIDR